MHDYSEREHFKEKVITWNGIGALKQKKILTLIKLSYIELLYDIYKRYTHEIFCHNMQGVLNAGRKQLCM